MPPAVAQVPSPRRKVVLFAVPEPSRAVPTVPDARLLAFKDVRLAPLAAGSVAGKRASGTVPEPRLEAFRLVSDAPEPLGASTSVPITKPRFDLAVVVLVRSERLFAFAKKSVPDT